ncbi:hypothetical protein [Rubritalea tangerina]|uniref:FeoB-associated Cys-rich membrane protein n=1 Tax=Rubritalea tangerina TaxID=430798 RepID=A0ABW4ZB46_9BACT
MPSTQTILALSFVAAALLFLAWKIYRSLKSSACCGSCGCNLMSDKAKKKMLKKRKQAATRKTASLK